jgi:thioredoxin 2
MSDIVACPSCGASNRLPSLSGRQHAVCGKCKTPLTGRPIDVTDANFDRLIADGRPTIVDFWAAWCGPCRMIAPLLTEIAAERSDVRIAKLNVDDNSRTSARFGVQGIPLLVFFKDGVERGRVVGAVPKSQIEGAIAQFLA